jgi:hypothetical protein
VAFRRSPGTAVLLRAPVLLPVLALPSLRLAEVVRAPTGVRFWLWIGGTEGDIHDVVRHKHLGFRLPAMAVLVMKPSS